MSSSLAAKIDFKRAQSSDLHELSEWIRRYYAYDHIAFDETRVKAGLESMFANETYGCAYFVTLGEKTIGYFLLTFAFDIEYGGLHAMVTDLYFSEDTRGLGAGSKTFKFIESLCTEKKISALLLQVETDNHEAQAFYQKMGLHTLTRFQLVKNLVKP